MWLQRMMKGQFASIIGQLVIKKIKIDKKKQLLLFIIDNSKLVILILSSINKGSV